MMEGKSESNGPPEKAVKELVKFRRLNPGENYHKGNHTGKAIHSPRKHGPSGPRRDVSTPAVKEAAAVTITNDLELEPAREEIRQLVQRSMTAAEAGVQLTSLLQRHPNL